MTVDKRDTFALVTGAASGIGFGIARALADDGQRVIVVDRSHFDPAAVTAKSDLVYFEQFDLTHTGDIPGFVQQLVDKYGLITKLVNNAGIHKGSMIEHTSEEDWNAVVQINLTVPFLMIKHLIPIMRQAGGGAIVNMSSRNAFRSTTGNNAYDTTKSGLLGLTRTAAGELAEDNIRVNAVCPGIISTPMKDEQSTEGKLLKSIHAKLVPLKRYGVVEEVANVVLFLLSDKASFITGSSLIADGGQLACMNNSRLMEIPSLAVADQ